MNQTCYQPCMNNPHITLNKSKQKFRTQQIVTDTPSTARLSMHMFKEACRSAVQGNLSQPQRNTVDPPIERGALHDNSCKPSYFVDTRPLLQTGLDSQWLLDIIYFHIFTFSLLPHGSMIV